MPVYYMYCACVKFDFLASELMTMPGDTQHNWSSKRIISVPSQSQRTTLTKEAKCDRDIVYLLNQSIRIVGSTRVRLWAG